MKEFTATAKVECGEVGDNCREVTQKGGLPTIDE
jgi:hypothetical protein